MEKSSSSDMITRFLKFQGKADFADNIALPPPHVKGQNFKLRQFLSKSQKISADTIFRKIHSVFLKIV